MYFYSTHILSSFFYKEDAETHCLLKKKYPYMLILITADMTPGVNTVLLSYKLQQSVQWSAVFPFVLASYFLYLILEWIS